MKRVYPKPADTDQPCQECDGEKGSEIETGFQQGRTDGFITYRWESCERCEGTGIDPYPTESDDNEDE